jgi:hypothetical protein
MTNWAIVNVDWAILPVTDATDWASTDAAGRGAMKAIQWMVPQQYWTGQHSPVYHHLDHCLKFHPY